MLMEQNAFGSPDVSTAKLNGRLHRPAQHVLRADGKGNCWQMAVLGPGMQARAGSGAVGSVQFRVVATVPHWNGVIMGLVIWPEGLSTVADDRYRARQ